MLIKSAENKRTTSISEPKINVREAWLNELQLSRRVYFFQKWKDQGKERHISGKELLEWLRLDLLYLFESTINLLLNLRKFGPAIKKEYGISYFRQLYRMAFLVYVIRTKAARFRLNHLFHDNRWKRVKEYAFSKHIRVHNVVLGYPHHEELGILAHKLKFYHYCKNNQINTPEILAVYSSGLLTSPSSLPPEIPKKDLFMKEVAGGNGRGAKKFMYDDGFYRDSNGAKYFREDLNRFFVDYSNTISGIIIQDALQNHDYWKKFTSGGLATCRIVTGISPLDTDEIMPFFATVKMPVGKTEVDNYSKGSIAAFVDMDTGLMKSATSSVPYKGKFVFDYHPDTGHKIEGEVLPGWKELIDFAKTVHLHFETISVGWDISLTNNGITVLEGNVEWGSDVIEGPSGRPIADTVYTEWFNGWRNRMKHKKVIPYKLPRNL